jgi:Tol biopolymer transport system component
MAGGNYSRMTTDFGLIAVGAVKRHEKKSLISTFHRLGVPAFLFFLSSCSNIAGSASIAASPLKGTNGVTAAVASELASPTPTPQFTSVPPTDTPLPAGLNPQGPYVLFEGDAGIWIANPDGGFLTRISDRGIRDSEQDIHNSISPQGDRIALVVAGAKGPDLIAVDLPTGKASTIEHLQDITQKEIALNSFTPKAFAYYALTQYPDLAWQPGSNDVLAFLGAVPGPSADLFSYDFTTGKTRQLVQDPTQTIDPIWSPDGKYLLHIGISWVPPYGATYVGFHPMDGLWAVRISDGVEIPQPAPKGTFHNLLGWSDDTHYLMYTSDEKCIARNLRSVDVTTGLETPIVDFCFYTQPAWSPENGAVIFSIDSGCSCSLEEGTYLLLPESLAPWKISDKKAYVLTWLPESGLFQSYPEALFSPDGSTRYEPPLAGASYQPTVSKSGNQAWEVIENRIHRVKIKFPDGTWREILEGDVGAMVWDPLEGNTLLIAFENGTLLAASAPDFVPREMGSMDAVIRRAAWVP